MDYLKLVDLEGNHLGSIYRQDDGTLELDVLQEALRTDLEDLFKQVLNEPVYLLSGEKTVREGKIVFQSKRSLVEPEAQDFLLGIKDQITRNKLCIGGLRVRGLLIKHGEQTGE